MSNSSGHEWAGCAAGHCVGPMSSRAEGEKPSESAGVPPALLVTNVGQGQLLDQNRIVPQIMRKK